MNTYKNCNFKDSSFYYVWVSMFDGNPRFKAVLYTGFDTGAYRNLFNSSGSFPLKKTSLFEIISYIGNSNPWEEE